MSRRASTSGVPAVFDRSLFPELHPLSGERGAKAVIMRHRERCVPIGLPEAAIDIDTVHDYRLLLAR
jgi:molybdenum cofactor cytidylyltransferase